MLVWHYQLLCSWHRIHASSSTWHSPPRWVNSHRTRGGLKAKPGFPSGALHAPIPSQPAKLAALHRGSGTAARASQSQPVVSYHVHCLDPSW